MKLIITIEIKQLIVGERSSQRGEITKRSKGRAESTCEAEIHAVQLRNQ